MAHRGADVPDWEEPEAEIDCDEWHAYWKELPKYGTIKFENSGEELAPTFASRHKQSVFGDKWESVFFQINGRFLLMFQDNKGETKLMAAYYLHKAVSWKDPGQDPPFQVHLQLAVPKKPKGKRIPVKMSFSNAVLQSTWCERLDEVSQILPPSNFVVGAPSNVEHKLHMNAQSAGKKSADSDHNPDAQFGIDLLPPEAQAWLKRERFLGPITKENAGVVRRIVEIAQSAGTGEPRSLPQQNLTLKTISEGKVKSLDELSTKGKPQPHYDFPKQAFDKGMQGAVYLCLDKKSKEEVAIKHVQLKAANTKGAAKELELLQSEIAFLFACRHENIVRLDACYKDARDVYLVMECMSGGKLTDLVEEPRCLFEEWQISVIMRETIKGLAYLHKDGCMHRDIKSDNVLINKKGEVKLGDFGFVASVTGAGGVASKRHTVVGTPYWMAPELITGDYDLKADIWSIGIFLIELCDKEPPWMDLSPTNAMYKIIHSPPPTLINSRRKWSKELHEFLKLSLIMKPKDRWSAEKLLTHPFITAHASKDSSFLGPMQQKYLGK